MELLDDYYDLELREYAFKDLKILLGPAADETTINNVRLLCDKYLTGIQYEINKSHIKYQC